MKSRKRVFIYTSVVVLFVFSMLIGCGYMASAKGEDIEEEAIPIRDNGVIVGMDYHISIDTNKSNIVINTKLIDSIRHYKDISLLDELYVTFKFNNKSNNNYYLKKIEINNNSRCIKKYNYNFFINNREYITILLNKNILKHINNDNSIVKIYIERNT